MLNLSSQTESKFSWVSFIKIQSSKNSYWLSYRYLDLKKNDRVLEIGTGTGYQTAILASLCKYVYTVEIFQELLSQAKINHNKLKLKNINYMLGNGANGWNKTVLFDAIIIGASAEKISSKLLKSLKDKGNLIFPKKYSFENQALLLLKKVNAYKYTSQRLFDVKFVPLLNKNIEN